MGSFIESFWAVWVHRPDRLQAPTRNSGLQLLSQATSSSFLPTRRVTRTSDGSRIRKQMLAATSPWLQLSEALTLQRTQSGNRTETFKADEWVSTRPFLGTLPRFGVFRRFSGQQSGRGQLLTVKRVNLPSEVCFSEPENVSTSYSVTTDAKWSPLVVGCSTAHASNVSQRRFLSRLFSSVLLSYLTPWMTPQSRGRDLGTLAPPLSLF